MTRDSWQLRKYIFRNLFRWTSCRQMFNYKIFTFCSCSGWILIFFFLSLNCKTKVLRVGYMFFKTAKWLEQIVGSSDKNAFCSTSWRGGLKAQVGNSYFPNKQARIGYKKARRFTKVLVKCSKIQKILYKKAKGSNVARMASSDLLTSASA